MYTITDAVCLKILAPDCLLLAIGNELHFYQQIGDSTFHKHQAIDFCDKIHGIQCIRKDVDFDIIIFGGRELALIQLKDKDFKHIKSVKLSDWINNINFYENELNSFCCLTSHSVALKFIIVWHTDGKDANVEISRKISCPDKSTLYSSLILGTMWCSTVIFGGTALGNLVVWREIDDEAIILHRLTGHNGVIFSINCNIEHNIVTTTSDDRSIKIWKIYFDKGMNWSSCMIKPMKSLFGHTARVFRSKIIIENGVPYIISIGEDAKICIWTKSGSLLYKKSFNCGGTLWNLDYNSAKKTIFLCGSDGNVRQMRLENVFNKQISVKEVVDVDILEKDEYLSKIKVLDNNRLIALTNENRLVYQNIQNHWMVCSFDFYKCCLLEKYKRFVAIAGYQRASVFEYDHNFSLQLIYETTEPQNMVRSFKFLNDKEYLLCDEIGNCFLFNTSLNRKIKFSLPLTKDTCITAALMQNEFLFIGDRSGDLHLFEIASNEAHHRHRLKKIHGNLGCTVIIAQDNKYLTSGHDGTIKVIALDKNSKRISVQFMKKLPILWVDRVIDYGTERLYAGFNDKHFNFASNECDIVDEIDCGGRHRCWDLLVDETIAKFVFIRSKMLHSVLLAGYTDDKEKQFKLPILKWHIASCNAIQCIELNNDDVIVVSGGDDNVLKLSKFRKTIDSHLEHVQDMVQHTSCIKSISLIPMSSREWLVVSAGGRAQICITEIAITGDQIHMSELTNFMLNSDNDRKRLGKSQITDFDPQTRFMSVACSEDFQIFAGCSDGYIRHFHFDPITRKIHTINSLFYGKCLLYVYYLNHDDKKYLLTMATDGLICFWKITSGNLCEIAPFHRLRHHNSGINSFDIILFQNQFRIATGGDDQSTVLSYFHIKNESVELVQTIILHYHTAQVNGMKFSSDGRCLYTVSVDQNVYKLDLLTFAPQKYSRSMIADSKGLHIFQNNQILVYGCGIQFFNAKTSIS